MKPAASIVLSLVLSSLAFAGRAAATEVRTPGAGPAMVVEVPDSSTVDQMPSQVRISLAPGTLPILTMGVVVVDPAKDNLDTQDYYNGLSAAILTGMVQALAGTVVSQDPGSHVFIGGKPGYLYKGAIENQSGGQFTVKVVMLKIDATHVGLFALVSAQGRETVGGLEEAMRAAKVALQ